MNRDLIYRLLGYALGGILLRYAALNTAIWIFWSEIGYLNRYYPAWWIALAAAMTVMAAVLFIPAIVPQRHRGTAFTLLRAGAALFLLTFCWYWCEKDGWIFHDWVAHPYLNECSGAHDGDQFLVLLATLAYASIPIGAWQVQRWRRKRANIPAELRRAMVRRRWKRSIILGGVTIVLLAVATVVLVRDPQKAQREKIKSTFRARGALFSYTAPRRVRAIPIIGDILSETLYKFGMMEFSGISGYGDPVEDVDLQTLSGYINLMDITLEKSKVTDTGIKYLAKVPNLERVNLDGCRVTDASIRDIIRIPRLETISIRDTEITQRGARWLQAALPDCYIDTTKKPDKAPKDSKP